VPLVEELQVSLKDLLPQEGVVLTNDKGGAIATVSERLYKELKRYAATNRLPLITVLGQLRNEIHKAA
jgi:hypothetical protein